MGAWGTGNFDNDTALDWVYELEKTEDLSLVEHTIDAALSEGYIDADIGAELLAAIEVIASIKGKPEADDLYREDVDRWVLSHKLQVPQDLIDKAKKALSLMLTDKSELYELWSETDEFEEWIKTVSDLRSRELVTT